MTKLTNEKIPYFNAPIYLQNKTQIGKVDEIFGPINESVSQISRVIILLPDIDASRGLSLSIIYIYVYIYGFVAAFLD